MGQHYKPLHFTFLTVVGRDVKLFSHEEVSVIDVLGELEHLSNEGLPHIKAAHGSCEQQGEDELDLGQQFFMPPWCCQLGMLEDSVSFDLLEKQYNFSGSVPSHEEGWTG